MSFGIYILLMFLFYIILIKNSEKFKNFKNIFILAFLIGIPFVIMLPNTSKDVYYYMGNGRLISKFGQNPYNISIADFERKNNIFDEILNFVSDNQKNYKFVYGPLFLAICGLLNKISFSSVWIYLYEFKLLNFFSYLITIFLVYKLTKKKKLTVFYAFNPLVILESLVNVHNDIIVLMFALFGIYFIKEFERSKKESKYFISELTFLCGLVFLAFSACIKYITILIIPFIIIYKIKNEKWYNKFFMGITYLLTFLGVFIITYIPYIDGPFGIINCIISQTGKLKDSIYLIIAEMTNQNEKIVSICYSIGFFVLLYIFIVKILMQLFRKNTFKVAMENSYSILFWLIFLGLTNLTSWYLIWLFIPVYWTNGEKVKNLMWIGFFYELTYMIFFITHSENVKYQVFILPCIMLGMVIRKIFLNLKEENKKIEND